MWSEYKVARDMDRRRGAALEVPRVFHVFFLSVTGPDLDLSPELLGQNVKFNGFRPLCGDL